MSEQQALVEFIGKAEERFKNAPIWMRFEQEQSFAIQQLTANDFLYKTAAANPASLLSAMSNVASIGLSLNPAKKQAYLVPRKGVVCLDPSYMGMCDLAIQSGSIVFVQAKTVHAEDVYVNNGIDAMPTHSYQAFKDRGEIVGFYCVAKTSAGDYLTTEMSKEKVDGIMARSEAAKANKGPWITDYEEMAKKSVVRQAFKLWPKTDTLERLAMAVDLSNQNEEFEPLLTSPELHDYSEDQKKYFDEMITNNDAIGMYCFLNSLDEGVRISLHNSFQKGTITKYKGIVSKLETEGSHKLADIRLVINESIQTGDDMACKELLADIPQEAIDYLKNNGSDELRQYIDTCIQELAQ